MRIGCIVMASGESTRFGSNKLVADFCGKPLIQHTLEHLPQEDFAKIVVVTRYCEVKNICDTLSINCILHTQPLQSDTVRIGIEAMQDMEGCLFCVGDQPLCTKQSMHRMTQAFAQQPQNIFRLCFEKQAGNPVLFPRHLFTKLVALPAGKGGGAVIAAYPSLVRAVAAQHATELFDVDTPAALKALEAQTYDCK